MATPWERQAERLAQRVRAQQQMHERLEGTRQTLFDHLTQMQNPAFGRDAFIRMALDAMPASDQFLTEAAARGGSFRQAQERMQAARSRARQQALSAFEGFQLQQQQGVTRGLLGLLDTDLQRQQLAEQRRQFNEQNEGPGLGGFLGMAGGTLLGSFLGPLGATAGASIGGRLFGGGGSGGGGSAPFTPGLSYG